MLMAEAVCQFGLVSSVRGVNEDKDEVHKRAHAQIIAVRCLQGCPSHFPLGSEAKLSHFRKVGE